MFGSIEKPCYAWLLLSRLSAMLYCNVVGIKPGVCPARSGCPAIEGVVPEGMCHDTNSMAAYLGRGARCKGLQHAPSSTVVTVDLQPALKGGNSAARVCPKFDGGIAKVKSARVASCSHTLRFNADWVS